MKNMKVSAKLTASFLIVIALAILVGGVGILGMYQINVADDAMYNGNYLPTVMAADIVEQVVTQRVLIRNFVIFDVNTDADLFRDAENSLATSRSEMERLLKEYDGTIETTEDRQLFTNLSTIYNNEWKALVDNIHDLGAANQTEEAKSTLQQSSAVAASLGSVAAEMQQLNMSAGKTAVDGNTTLFITMTVIEIVVLVIAVSIALILSVMISGMISKPLAVLTSFMNRAGSSGDIKLTAEDTSAMALYSQYKDETGQCIASTSSFINHVAHVSETLETIASGDLTSEFALLSDKDVMGLSLRKMLDNLNNMFSEIKASTTQVAVGSKQIADGAQSLAQGSTQQAAAVEQLSSSITEIAQKTKDNADMATNAANLAETIKGNAEKGSRQMGEMTQAVREINDASQSISKVISTIDNIAFQTNILALNAAVEAARAGQHGKGFAVVAEEVRSLATKSADAARETGGMIQNSMEKAALGARIAEETAASLVDIVSGINESSALVSQIASSSQEQSEGISQINKGIDQVAQVIQQNSATAEESAASSEEMSGQSNMLEELISQFRLKDGSGLSLGSGRPSSAKQQRKLEMPEKTTYKPSASGDFGKY